MASTPALSACWARSMDFFGSYIADLGNYWNPSAHLIHHDRHNSFSLVGSHEKTFSVLPVR